MKLSGCTLAPVRILITALLGLLTLAALLLATGCDGDDRPQVQPSPAVAAQADAPAQQEQPPAVEPTSDATPQQTDATTEQQQQQAQEQVEPQVQEAAQQQSQEQAQVQSEVQEAVQQQVQQQVRQQAQAQTQAVTVVDRAPIQLGGDRPATLLLPGDLSAPLPLVMLLHGYTMSAESIDRFFGISARVETDRFALIVPDGTENAVGDRFWNATPQCCDFARQQIDDVTYLSVLVAEARNHAEFDRLYLIGYSNGGYMSYRLACEGLTGLTAIVSLAGSSFVDAEQCLYGSPISVLQIHGDADTLVPYASGTSGPPGAVELVTRWAERAGCDADAVVELDPIDLDGLVSGAETTVQRVRDGCVDGITVELWTMEGVGHVPRLTPAVFAERVLAWLLNDARGPAES